RIRLQRSPSQPASVGTLDAPYLSRRSQRGPGARRPGLRLPLDAIWRDYSYSCGRPRPLQRTSAMDDGSIDVKRAAREAAYGMPLSEINPAEPEIFRTDT